MKKTLKKVKILNLLILISFFNVGCSIPSNNIASFDNSKHVVGNKESAVKTLIYVEKENEQIKKKLIFYIDKFPYKRKVNLCPEQNDFKLVKSVISDVTNKTKVTYSKPPRCDSSISVLTLNNDTFFVSIDLIFLLGYDKRDVHGYTSYLPVLNNIVTSNFRIEKIALNKRSTSNDNVIRESYWYFEE